MENQRVAVDDADTYRGIRFDTGAEAQRYFNVLKAKLLQQLLRQNFAARY
jgi:hypothetical protein